MTQSISITTNSPEETEALGERLGRALKPGMVLALMGNLGAGKTTLTKGLAKGLGVSDLIHSPTFNLIHEHKGRVPVYHFDLYRLTSMEQIEDLGYEDYFYGEGVTVIEWPEKVLPLLPEDHLEVSITGKGDRRTFAFTATGPLSASVLNGISPTL
jgi:tRNA threonylcarbamoyladenosine biosynthesis protein TsaE